MDFRRDRQSAAAEVSALAREKTSTALAITLSGVRVRLDITGRGIGGVLTDEGSGNEIPEYHHFR